MVVAYSISGYDNGTVMFEEGDALPKCPRCGWRLETFAHNPGYRQSRKRRSDLLSTYDNADIVSRRFKDFCVDHRYANAECLSFKNDPAHFQLIVREPVVEFDAERRRTRFVNFCSACGKYESVVGATPAYLKLHEPLADGFYRTDLEFASRNGKHPLIIIGAETKAKMLSYGLKGIIFEEAIGFE